jgi:hypothetical protein
LAIARAQRQLAEEAQVYLHIRNFAVSQILYRTCTLLVHTMLFPYTQVINQVGAASLRATLNCDAFATEHSESAHYDKSSFVGLAWRPPRESICCEVYSTGRANLPGSVVERQLLASFSRMLPELLRFSSSHHLLSIIPEELQDYHRKKQTEGPLTSLLPKLGAIGTARARCSTGPTAPTAIAPTGAIAVKKKGIWDDWGDNNAAVVLNEMSGVKGNDYKIDDDDDEEFDLTSWGL